MEEEEENEMEDEENAGGEIELNMQEGSNKGNMLQE